MKSQKHEDFIMELTNRTILITGGASGIGFALAKQLVANGNKVIVCGRS
ncbi:MAG: SDR family NAD(P)-dependent oxidoreductase [Gammaproteobacteria bacterium]|nr:SDR family NAD(P)-dependent oxidoreductase [Gammaproteobacteria bacterium]MBT4862830.1 SDR family NAD(P)-dependent oxidoreductase [Gammaproteobacteria bacterium]MBT7208458.1 SDR family NAD(P)-dependent oxidoreductase [Gammaproteobacteria bacterium]